MDSPREVGAAAAGWFGCGSGALRAVARGIGSRAAAGALEWRGGSADRCPYDATAAGAAAALDSGRDDAPVEGM
jgi:hypothetical protein